MKKPIVVEVKLNPLRQFVGATKDGEEIDFKTFLALNGDAHAIAYSTRGYPNGERQQLGWELYFYDPAAEVYGHEAIEVDITEGHDGILAKVLTYWPPKLTKQPLVVIQMEVN